MILDQCSFNCLLKRLSMFRLLVCDRQSWHNARDAIASKKTFIKLLVYLLKVRRQKCLFDFNVPLIANFHECCPHVPSDGQVEAAARLGTKRPSTNLR